MRRSEAARALGTCWSAFDPYQFASEACPLQDVRLKHLARPRFFISEMFMSTRLDGNVFSDWKPGSSAPKAVHDRRRTRLRYARHDLHLRSAEPVSQLTQSLPSAEMQER